MGISLFFVLSKRYPQQERLLVTVRTKNITSWTIILKITLEQL